VRPCGAVLLSGGDHGQGTPHPPELALGASGAQFSGAGAYHGLRRQRRLRHRHVLDGRVDIRLPLSLDHPVGHHRRGDRAGNGRAHGRLHRQGPDRPDPRALWPADDLLCHAGADPGEPGHYRVAVRGHRGWRRVVRRVPVHRGSDRRDGHLVAGAPRILSTGRKSVARAVPVRRGVRDLGAPGPAGLGRGAARDAGPHHRALAQLRPGSPGHGGHHDHSVGGGVHAGLHRGQGRHHALVSRYPRRCGVRRHHRQRRIGVHHHRDRGNALRAGHPRGDCRTGRAGSGAGGRPLGRDPVRHRAGGGVAAGCLGAAAGHHVRRV